MSLPDCPLELAQLLAAAEDRVGRPGHARVLLAHSEGLLVFMLAHMHGRPQLQGGPSESEA